MTPQQAHELKLKTASFAEATAMLEHAKKVGPASLDTALATRDKTRNDLYSFIDSIVRENDK
jgi:hypothetical protein